MVPLATLAAFALGQGLLAHEAMFGNSPHALFKGQWELEWQIESEASRNYRHGTKSLPNPTRDREYETTFAAEVVYALSHAVTVHAEVPVTYIEESSLGFRAKGVRFGDWELGGEYRLFGTPSPRGYVQLSAFAEAMIPTAPRDPSSIGSTSGSLGYKTGLAAEVTNGRSYGWASAAITGQVRDSTGGDGDGAVLHLAYAWRVWPLLNFDEPDLVLMTELDVAGQKPGRASRAPDPDSGFTAVYGALGVHFNLTNRHEFKIGYNFPLLRRVNGIQLVDDGELKLTYSYLF